MKYERIKRAKFIERKNRFIAEILIDGKLELCHVKTTGRCKELFIKGADIFVQEVSVPGRKTKYDLISVYQNDMLINTDSQVANTLCLELIKHGGLFKDVKSIRQEYGKLNSRFDFYVEYEDKKAFIEVKGVTLEENGVALFPDAPTSRGLKHINDLIELKAMGYEAYIIFMVQMENALVFRPNIKQDKAFADGLKRAKIEGVNIKAFRCFVGEDSIYPLSEIEVRI